MKAVIVVDLINGFCREGNLASPRLSSVVPGTKDYLHRELDAGAQAIFLIDTHEPNDAEFETFPPHCVRGSGEDEVVDDLRDAALRSRQVRKSRYSGFYGTDLARMLKDLAPDEVEVVGVCTDICVLHTVADLRNRDYRVTVRADLVETYDGPVHPGDEMTRWALLHMCDVLGASIV